VVAHQPPPSPPAPRVRHPSWLDLRLITGVLLVLVSVLLGAKVVATADRSVQVWALTHDVSAGTTLVPDDLQPARVRLFENAAAYLRAIQSPAGRTVTRTLRAGELLPRSAIVAAPPGEIVAIPVQSDDAPGLAHGQLIDVWSTAKGCAPVQVLSRVPVQEVKEAGGSLAVGPGSTLVIVRVEPTDAHRVIAALGGEVTIRLVVLEGDLPAAPHPTAAVDRCMPTGGQVSSQSPPTPTAPVPSQTPARPGASNVGSGGPSPTSSPAAEPTTGSR
jgi:SAF domain